METVGKIRRRRLVKEESISAIARDLNCSRNTVRKYLKAGDAPVYQRQTQPCPKLGKFQEKLTLWLEQDAARPKNQRRSAQRLFENLQREDYAGAYDSVQRFVKRWKATRPVMTTDAFVPLVFAPGDACQFDWSHEQAVLGGVAQTIKLAHFRLCHSRQPFVVAYPRESQEMVFDAHNRAFAFFGGVPNRMIYDNPKTIVDAVFNGKSRQFNRRFLALASHYLFEPVACTPASGWEKGQVENQVGNIREWLFTPTPRFADLAGLNVWLETRCRELGNRPHPTLKEHPIAAVFALEQPHLRATADRIRVVAEGQEVANHARSFVRETLVLDPWHYLPVLERKPGALRNGAPFVAWALPQPIAAVKERLLKQPKGDRAVVEILLAMRDHGTGVVETACALALESDAVTAPVILNHVHRLLAPVRLQLVVNVPGTLKLAEEPLADCRRYDGLREVAYAG